MIYQGRQQATAQPVQRKEEKKDDDELLKESLKLAVQIADPTGISSWGDLADSWQKANDEGWTVNNTLDVGLNLLSSIPVVSAIPLVKGIKGAGKAAKVGKMLKGVDKTNKALRTEKKVLGKQLKLAGKASDKAIKKADDAYGALAKRTQKLTEKLNKASGKAPEARQLEGKYETVSKQVDDINSKILGVDPRGSLDSKHLPAKYREEYNKLQKQLQENEKEVAKLNKESMGKRRPLEKEENDLSKQVEAANKEVDTARSQKTKLEREAEKVAKEGEKRLQQLDTDLMDVPSARGKTTPLLKGMAVQAAAAGLTGASNYAGQKADQVFGTNIAPYLTLGMGILGTIGGGKMVGSPKLGKYTGNGTDIKIGGVNKKSTAAIDALKKEKAEVQQSRGFLQKLNRWSGKNKKVRELDKKINLEEKMLSNGVFSLDDLKGNKKASLVKDLLREQGVTKNDALSLVDVEGTKFVRIADKKGNVRFMDGDGKTFIASGKGNLWTGRPRALRQDVPDSLDELIDVTGHYGLVDYTKLLGKDWQSSVANAAMPIGLSGAGIGMMSKQPQQRDLAQGDIQGIMFNPNNQVYDANLGGYRRPTMGEATQMYTEQLLQRQSSGERLKPYEQRFLGQGQQTGVSGVQGSDDDMLNALIQLGAQTAQ